MFFLLAKDRSVRAENPKTKKKRNWDVLWKTPRSCGFFWWDQKGFRGLKIVIKKDQLTHQRDQVFRKQKRRAFGNLNSRGTRFGSRKLRFDPISLREFLGVKKKKSQSPMEIFGHLEKIPPRELTCPPKIGILKMMFLFLFGGICDRSLEGRGPHNLESSIHQPFEGSEPRLSDRWFWNHSYGAKKCLSPEFLLRMKFPPFQERYNTPLEHTPGNPPSQLSKEPLYGLLVKV